jgi:hypothetical protein
MDRILKEQAQRNVLRPSASHLSPPKSDAQNWLWNLSN